MGKHSLEFIRQNPLKIMTSLSISTAVLAVGLILLYMFLPWGERELAPLLVMSLVFAVATVGLTYAKLFAIHKNKTAKFLSVGMLCIIAIVAGLVYLRTLPFYDVIYEAYVIMGNIEILFLVTSTSAVVATGLLYLYSFVFHKEQAARVLFIVSASAAVISVALICLFLFMQGLSAMFDIGIVGFLTGTTWRPSWDPPIFGILPMIVGSIYVTAGAILFGVPIGIFAAVFMAKVCPKPLYKILKPAINLLAGIPSVVYGYFGISVLVPFVRQNFGGDGASILTASILLGIMILPTVITISESALRAVPREMYEGAVALGASHERAVFAVVLPAAKSGIMAAVVLGVGRAFGETMAVQMVAGNQPLMRMPHEFLEGMRTLTANIVIEMGYASGIHREALVATGVVLFVFILIINILFSLLMKRGESK